MRMRGTMAKRCAARTSYSGGVDFSMGVVFNAPLSSVTSGSTRLSPLGQPLPAVR